MLMRLIWLLLCLVVLSTAGVGCAPRGDAPGKPAAGRDPAPASGGASASNAATAGQSPAPATARDEQALAAFYRGKTLRVVVGSAAGGPFDLYARMAARHMRKYIPGNPNIIVDNIVGAGNMVAMNQLYNNLPRDGTVMGHVAGSLVLQQLFGAPGVEFDAARLHYLGTPSDQNNYVLIVTRESGITSFEELLPPQRKPIVLGSNPPGQANYTAAMLAREVLGINVRLVSGYDGQSKIILAMQHGEVDGTFTTWETTASQNRDKLASGEWLVIAQWTETPIKEHPNLPNVHSFAKTPEDLQLLRLGVSVPNRFIRPFLLPPGVPEDRVRALEAAFDKTMADPEFVAEAERTQLDVSPLGAADLRTLVLEYLQMPPTIKTRLQQVAQGTGG
jgi:tripartite-type tricarboxylate transporter receptor subunit TctC